MLQSFFHLYLLDAAVRILRRYMPVNPAETDYYLLPLPLNSSSLLYRPPQLSIVNPLFLRYS